MPKTKPSRSASTGSKLAYTREEAAAQLGMCAMTITRLTQRGLLRASRGTRRPIYSHEELQRYLRESVA